MSPILTQLTYYCAVIGGLIVAMFVGSSLGSENYASVALSFGSILGVLWILFAGERWWLPMPFALGIGGFFTIPFKLYPHEIALAVCGIALLPRIPFKPLGMLRQRNRIPIVFYLIFAYLLAHLAVCVTNYWDGEGLGNISRAYMNALWPFIFGLGFYWYGSSSVLQGGLRLLYLALLIRMGFGLLNFYLDDVIVLPVVNYSIDPQDLRTSGYMLLTLSALMLVAGRNPIAKVGHALVFLVSVYAWLLGGSRAQVAGVIVLCFVFFLILRQYVAISIFGALTAILVVALNVAPTLVEPFPYRIQRAMAGMIFTAEAETDIQQDVKGSDQFRSVISAEGQARWTASPRSIAFGTGIRPFDENFFFAASRFEVDAFTLLIQSAADVGAYETGLWTVLAVTGLTGALLYAWLMLQLILRLLPPIRAGITEGAGYVITVWAAGALISWFPTCFLFGAYPSFEIFLGIVALGYVEDRRRAVGWDYGKKAKSSRHEPAPRAISGGPRPQLAHA